MLQDLLVWRAGKEADVDSEAEQVRLLLAEKAYIEQRINANLDLQQKVAGAGLGAVITALGWVCTTRPELPAPSIVTILFAIVSISALSVVMAVIYGGLALGAMTFKQDVLGAQLQSILHTPAGIFGALRATGLGVAGRTIAVATKILYGAHLGLSVAVYLIAVGVGLGAMVGSDGAAAARLAWLLPAGALVAGGMLVGSIVSLSTFRRAVKRGGPAVPPDLS